MDIIINKLPEVIKCIIYDYVGSTLNYWIELQSDKFIGNPINFFKSFGVYTAGFYHTNKLTNIKIPLHFISLDYCKDYEMPHQEILNKLQRMNISCYKLDISYLYKLPCIKNLTIYNYKLTEFPNIVGLLELRCYNNKNLIKIPNIIGLKILICHGCDNLTEIPHIKGLLELYCICCEKLTEIPHIIGLQKLACTYSPNLTKIPHIKGLQKLSCYCCEKLIEIPNIEGLLELRT